uniref:Uncharacterized protein n=1 Tax=Arundo donax TaxID=35708 RepID=A0A0A8XZ43_ARUDO
MPMLAVIFLNTDLTKRLKVLDFRSETTVLKFSNFHLPSHPPNTDALNPDDRVISRGIYSLCMAESTA